MNTENTESQNQIEEKPQYPCLCALIRKVGRSLTRKYGDSLKPSGLKVTQYSLLANIIRNPNVTVSDLAGLLVMDQSTLTRNLQVLVKMGYVYLEPDMTDNRIKKVHISNAGISKMDEARPLWEKAQLEMERNLGAENIEGIIANLAGMVE